MSDTVAAVFIDEKGAVAHPPILTLQIVQWKDAPPEGLKRVRAEIVACEYPDGSAGEADPSRQTSLGIIEFDLVPNDGAANQAAPSWKISKPDLVLVYSDSAGKLVKVTRDNRPRADHADFVVFLGVRQETKTTGKGAKQKTETVEEPLLIALSVPHHDESHQHDDRDDFTIGVVLTHPTAPPFSFIKKKHTAGATVGFVAPVRKMLGLGLLPAGGRTNVPATLSPTDKNYFKKESGLIGRFSDPYRNPHLAPDDARWKLDAEILKALPSNRNTALTEGSAVDVDGLLFKNFLPPGKTRRQVIDDFHAKVLIPPRWKNDALKKTDIQKAYFFFHDIGTDGFGPFLSDRYPTDSNAASESVHGFINMDGTVVTLFDLKEKKGGAVYEWTKTGKPYLNGFCIGYETVSAVDHDDTDEYRPGFNFHNYDRYNDAMKAGKRGKALAKFSAPWTDAPTEPYACIAKGIAYPPKKDDRQKLDKSSPMDAWFKWTHKLLDGFATLYILASARANHLLTIATHCEVDRNLMNSLVYWTTPSRSALKKEWSGVGAQVFGLIDEPGNVHSDPSGCDLQILYDKITAQLNAIGGTQLPTGVRYGTHRGRALQLDTLDKGHPGWAINGNAQLHSFPHQSNPNVVAGPWTTKVLGP